MGKPSATPTKLTSTIVISMPGTASNTAHLQPRCLRGSWIFRPTVNKDTMTASSLPTSNSLASRRGSRSIKPMSCGPKAMPINRYTIAALTGKRRTADCSSTISNSRAPTTRYQIVECIDWGQESKCAAYGQEQRRDSGRPAAPSHAARKRFALSQFL